MNTTPVAGSAKAEDSSSVSSEIFGENYIKETDDSRINRTMGVGACSLHPCLTRRAGGTNELSPGREEGDHGSMFANGKDDIATVLAMESAARSAAAAVAAAELLKPLDASTGSKQDDEEKLVELLKHQVHMRDGRDDHGLGIVAGSGIPLPEHEAKDSGRERASTDRRVQNAGEAQQESTLSRKGSGRYSAAFGHSYSTSQLRQSNVPLLQQQQQQQQHNRHGRAANSSASKSDNGAAQNTSAQLQQKRRELEMASMRHSEAAAHAVRTMERGLAESMRTGADTPTVDLVQTAVSVREVSKLIGRTVVQVSNVRRIMVVTKPNDTSLVSLTRDLATWLIDGARDEARQPIVVYVEERIARHRLFNLQRVCQRYPAAQTNIEFWTPELCAKSPEIFDFVVTLGGDGTVLYTSWLFQKTVPPIIPFHLGSLGFLTVFDHRHARRVLGSVINNGVRINLRMRFTCTVYRLADAVDPEHANVLVDAADCNKVINHAMATHGIQGADEYLCADAEPGADIPGSANLAAINSMSAAAGKKVARSFSASMRRPPPPMQKAVSSGTAGSRPAAALPSAGAAARAQHHSRKQSSTSQHRSDDDCTSNASGSAREDDGGTRSTARQSRAASGGTPPRAPRKRHTHAESRHQRHSSQQNQQSPSGIYSVQASDAARSRSRHRRSSGESRKSPPGSAHRGSVSSSKSQESNGGSAAGLGEEGEGEGEGAEKEEGVAGEKGRENGVPPLPTSPSAPSSGEGPLARHATIAESEWDDVPKPYQGRMRKVWKRHSTFQVMNEVVVDRGPSPYLSQLELYGDGNHLTTVEADGLCLATPTGSTAYSLAAGGSLVHPEIPAVLVTPICPHTLSFRPMLLPDTMVLRVVLPPDSRNTAWASFDGRHRTELRRGDHIQITASKYPLPTVCASQSQTQDWMSSLSRCLHWNERKRQKKFSGPQDLVDPGADAPDDGNYSYKRGISTDDNESPSDEDASDGEVSD